MDDERPARASAWSRQTREQRAAFWIVCVCGFLALGLSALAVNESLHGAFLVPASVLKQSQDFFDREQKLRQSDDVLRRWEANREALAQLEALKKSACPPGALNCDTASADVLGGSSATSVRQGLGIVGDRPASTNAASMTADVSVTSTLGTAAGIKPPAQMSPAQIRQFFLSKGLVSGDQARTLTDAQLLYIYTAAYNQALNAGPPASPSP